MWLGELGDRALVAAAMLRTKLASQLSGSAGNDESLPYRSRVGCADFSIPADDGNAKINSGRGDDAVWHVGHLITRHLAHGFNDLRIERSFLKHRVRIGQCGFQAVVNRGDFSIR